MNRFQRLLPRELVFFLLWFLPRPRHHTPYRALHLRKLALLVLFDQPGGQRGHEASPLTSPTAPCSPADSSAPLDTPFVPPLVSARDTSMVDRPSTEPTKSQHSFDWTAEGSPRQ